MSCKKSTDSIQRFTVEVADAPDIAGEGKPRRHFDFGDALVAGIPNADNLYENLLLGVQISGNDPFLGHRSIDENSVYGPYTWQTYSEVLVRVTNFGAYLTSVAEPLQNIGIFSINRSEWIIAENACFLQSFVTVPLYDTLGQDAIEFIINQASMSVIACTADKANILIKMITKIPTVKTLVIMDSADDKLKELGKSAGLQIIGFIDAESYGALNPVKANPMPANGVATICYTSGTTGPPKGVVLTHSNMLSAAGSLIALMKAKRFYQLTKSDRHISYLPLAHVLERVFMVVITHAGAQCGFYQGDTLKLLDDVAELKPTIFASVPRLYNRIYDRVNAAIKAKGGAAAFLFKAAYEAKKRALKSGVNKHWLWDKVIFGAVRARLGGSVKLMITGAAPLSADVVDFMRICFSGYGQTETAAAISVNDTTDMDSGHCGAPFPCGEVKLIDVPAMNYTSKDKPCPRGEICVRGPSVFSSYYMNEEKTKETIDDDGWCQTGDIGMWDEKGRLKLIDRVKNIFKLAQGEYVAPEKIEINYERHELVAQIFVYGDSLQATLVGIIIPDYEALKQFALSRNLGEKSLVEYCSDSATVEAVFKTLTAYVKTSDLKGFECLKKIRLHSEPFSMENDLLTPTFKLKRHQAKILFQSELTAMYAEVNAAFNAAGKEMFTKFIAILNCNPATPGEIPHERIHELFQPLTISYELGKPFAYLEFESIEKAQSCFERLNDAPIPSTKRVFKLQYLESIPQTTSIPKRIPDNILGLEYFKKFISFIDEKEILREIYASPWQIIKARRVQHYGHTFDYTTMRADVETQLLPQYTAKLLKLLRAKSPAIDHQSYDQLTINEYSPGQGISSHCDTHSAFGDFIAVISLQSDIEFELGDARIWVERGSAFIMSGPMRYAVKHGIRERKSDLVEGRIIPRGTRVSLTFRQVLPKSFRCGCGISALCDSDA